MKKADAATTCQKLKECFARFGYPKRLLSDNGGNFIARVTEQMLQENGITHVKASPYHPQSNGMVERVHFVLKTVLEKEREGDSQWDIWIPEVLMAIRCAPHRSTGFSPFQLLFGREARTPVTALREKMIQKKAAPKDIITYVTEMVTKMWETMEVVKAADSKSKDKSKIYYDRSTREDPLSEGEQVLYMSPMGTEGLTAKWEGPCKVLRKVGDLTYLIESPGRGKPIVRHRNFLKRFTLHVDMNTVITAAPDEDELDLAQLEYWTHLTAEEGTTDQELAEAKGMDTLQQDQKVELLQLLKKYRTSFSEVPGLAQVEPFTIKTGEARPVAQYPRRLAYHWVDKVKEETASLEKLGITATSSSPWSSPIVPVPKPDGSVRPCTDYKALNAITETVVYPLPRMEEVLQEVAGAQFITTMDLAKGFLQIPVAKEDQHKTAFVTPHGKWEYSRLPFGLKNAPAHFQKVMDTVLAGVHGARAYIDDVVVYTQTWEEHLKVLELTLQALAKHGFKIKLKKCHFGGVTLNFLGYRVGNGKMSVQEAKIKAVQQYVRPVTKKSTRAFLGLVNFYRRFIPNQATIVAPLTDATRKESPDKINWTRPREKAFEKIKEVLVAQPVLKAPDFTKQFVLATDASGVGLGAVLAQEWEDGLHPIAYWNRKLLPREANYAITELEALAMVEGVLHFALYLLGAKFVVVTDHKALTYWRQLTKAGPKVMRWVLALQHFDFEIRYKQGSANSNADALSRQDWSVERTDTPQLQWLPPQKGGGDVGDSPQGH